MWLAEKNNGVLRHHPDNAHTEHNARTNLIKFDSIHYNLDTTELTTSIRGSKSVM